MQAEKVILIYNHLIKDEIEIYIDGGWAIDALIGKQNREHSDLDIAISHDLVPKLRISMMELGFNDCPRKDTKDYNFVLSDSNQNLVDVHSYLFDKKGNNVYGIPYKIQDLKGKGFINEVQVNTITPESLLKFHTGYEVDGNDFFDVKLLCEKFDFEIPIDYKKFETIK